jgi:uncharacterized membrane protein
MNLVGGRASVRVKSILIIIAALWLNGLFWAGAQESSSPARSKGVLDVIVLDENNKPLAGVLVAVPGYRSTTGLGGTCRFGLLPGRYAVLISKPGYRGRRVNAGVRPGETRTLRVVLQKLPPAPSPRS